MTTIIGVQRDYHCILVADSLVTDENGNKWSHPDMEKLSKRGAFIVGGSGEVLACDIVQHIWNPPALTAADKKDVYHFMISKAMPSLRKCMRENGFNFDEEQEKGSGARFNFLMAVNGELFDIDEDLSVLRHGSGYYGVGSGSQYALGALYAGADPEEAVEIACELSAFSDLPLQVEIQYTR